MLKVLGALCSNMKRYQKFRTMLLAKARRLAWGATGSTRRGEGELRPRPADETHVTGVPTPQVSATHQLHQPPTPLLVLGQEVDAVNVELEVAVCNRTPEASTACRAAASCRRRRRVSVDTWTLSTSTAADAAADSHLISGVHYSTQLIATHLTTYVVWR